MSATYIGQCYLVRTESGELLTARCVLGVDRRRGLVSAVSRDALDSGRYLESKVGLVRINRLWYSRRRGGVRDWYHDVDNAFFSRATGAVSAGRATVCDVEGDFICGG